MFMFRGGDGLLVTVKSSEFKVQFLYEYRSMMSQIDSITKLFQSPFPVRHLEGLQTFAKLLSIVEVFASPIERRAIADDVVMIFEYIAKTGLVSTFLKFAAQIEDTRLQVKGLYFFL